MKVSELKAIIDRHANQHDQDVKLYVPLPYVGPRATVEIEGASFGFDWDRGLILRVKERLIPKTVEQDILEAANDLLMGLATECFVVKRQSYYMRNAARIMLRLGHTPEQLEKYVRLFHQDKPIINKLNKADL